MVLHPAINRAFTALWAGPVYILVGIFDIACFTMNTVLKINNKFFFATLLNPFINTCRAITR
jgi:hypothetical protein